MTNTRSSLLTDRVWHNSSNSIRLWDITSIKGWGQTILKRPTGRHIQGARNCECVQLAFQTRNFLPASPAHAFISFDLCGEIIWKIIGKGAVARSRGDYHASRENACPAHACPINGIWRTIDEHEVHCDARGVVKLIRSNGPSGSVILLSEARGPGAVGEELSDIQLLVSEGYSIPTPIGYHWMDVAFDTTKLYDEVISSSKKKIPDEKGDNRRNLAQNEGDD